MVLSMRWLWLVGLLLLGYLLYLLAPILTPFFAGIVLAYLFDPLVTRLTRWRIGRTVGTTLVFFVISLLLVLGVLALVPALIDQAVKLVRVVPELLTKLQTQLVPMINSHLGMNLDLQVLTQLSMQHAQEIGTVLAKSARVVFGNGSSVVLALMNLLLIPVIGFYFLRDWPLMLARVRALLPRAQESHWVALAGESNQVLGGFLRGQLAVMLANGVTYSLGLTFAGLETGIVIGMTAGMLSFVPYLGNIIGIAMALVAMYIQTGEWTPLLWVLVVFGVGQTLESVVWQPRFVGERIGLHPVAVIFAVMAGGALFGFFGVLLALPVSAILVVLGRHALAWYQGSAWYRTVEPVPTPEMPPPEMSPPEISSPDSPPPSA